MAATTTTKKPQQAIRILQADPNLPKWICQNCRQSLVIVGVDSYADKFLSDSSRSGFQGSTVNGAGSVMALTRMDHSFVVLPKQKTQPPGIPPRPRGVVQPDAVQSIRTMDESFVVLPSALASVYRSESTSDSAGTQVPSGEGNPGSQVNPNGSGFHWTISVLKHAFELATTQTQVEQPMCLECMRLLSDKMDKKIEDVNRDVKAYEACLKRLEGETHDVLSVADFFKEKLKIEEEERKLEAAIEVAERQDAEVNAELKELELKLSRFGELEERYWHEFNNCQFQLISHQKEADATLAKVEVTQRHLELLKGTNVLNDAFPISCDGEFGTINNFRLGRLPKVAIEWDETNAAWGQACLLLHTMCHHSMPKFKFGPVNLFWSTRYDKAMTLFLTCLNDFAMFARTQDLANHIPPTNCFTLPYEIVNDKVGKESITQSFNKHDLWTRALKYMLCNLKWVLYWFVLNSDSQALSAAEAAQARRSYAKRVANLKPDSRRSSRP
ncbi:Beclin-1-like protein [Drosera capensis]